MEFAVTTLDGGVSGNIVLSEQLFGLEPREDLLQRVVRWQLARRQQGTHNVLGRADISRTGSKMYKQKGTGGARHSSARAPQFRGGGKAHGPVVRSHAHSLPKKVRALGLRHALSAKFKSSDLVVIDDFASTEEKTKLLRAKLSKLGFNNALFVDGSEVNVNFARAAKNIPNVDVLPVQGINVYDILRRGKLVLSRSALDLLEERFK